MKELIDYLDDILTEFDEMGFVPTNHPHDHNSEYYAIDWKNRLINALEGYRKQSEGEWIKKDGFLVCSKCDATKPIAFSTAFKITYYKCDFCHRCGAKMKGGAE